MKKNIITGLMHQTLKSLELRKQRDSSMFYDVKKEEGKITEVNENTMNSSDGFLEENDELKRNSFENHEGNWFFNEGNEEIFAKQNIFNVDDFINFDVVS